MINLKEWELVKLEDVAEWEPAKVGKIYPAGTSTLQISATRGQIGFLPIGGEVETKNVAIIPCAGIDPKYFNITMQATIDEFMAKYATGLNIKEKDIGNFPIYLHNTETQKAIALVWDIYTKEAQTVEQELNNLKELKSRLTNDMFV